VKEIEGELKSLIQEEHQSKVSKARKLLDLITHEESTEIEYLAEGGFSKVYKAK